MQKQTFPIEWHEDRLKDKKNYHQTLMNELIEKIDIIVRSKVGIIELEKAIDKAKKQGKNEFKPF